LAEDQHRPLRAGAAFCGRLLSEDRRIPEIALSSEMARGQHRGHVAWLEPFRRRADVVGQARTTGERGRPRFARRVSAVHDAARTRKSISGRIGKAIRGIPGMETPRQKLGLAGIQLLLVGAFLVRLQPINLRVEGLLSFPAAACLVFRCTRRPSCGGTPHQSLPALQCS
jgi:hypothetical protein